VVQTLRFTDAVGDTSDVIVEQLLLSELAGGDSLPYVPLPNIPHPELCADGSVGKV